MHYKHTVESFLKPSITIRLLILILFIGSVFTGYKVVYYSCFYEMPEPKIFNINSKDGEYCCAQIQHLTKLIYENDDNSYYYAVDIYGNSFVLIISDNNYTKFKDIVNYTNSLVFIEPAPPPVEITGTVKRVDTIVAKSLADYFEYNSVEEYYDNFGSMILNTKDNPATSNIEGYLALFVFLFGYCVILFLQVLVYNNRLRMTITYINNAKGYENALRELNMPDSYLYHKHGLIITPRYVFMKGKGVVIKYEDILSCYNTVNYIRGVRINTLFIRSTYIYPTIKAIVISYVKKYDKDIDEALDIIIKNCPNL